MEYFIRVENEEKSAAIQKALFKIGFQWSPSHNFEVLTSVGCTLYKHIIFYNGKRWFLATNGDLSDSDIYKELFFDEIPLRWEHIT